MEHLGFDRDLGAVYEGSMRQGYRVLPPPSLTPIRFFTQGQMPGINHWLEGLSSLIFREDEFDFVTKLRKGRVFRLDHTIGTGKWCVVDPHRSDLETKVYDGTRVVQWTDLATYKRDTLDDFRKVPSASLPSVVLGWEPHITFWKIVSIECNLVGTPVLSLRAKHSLGDIPQLLEGAIPVELLKPLTEALEKVEASVNRLSPLEVIDRCRDVLSLAFGFQARDTTKDLAASIAGYLRAQSPEVNLKDNLYSWCGRIVARLHSRGKPNEQVDKNLRPPTDSDAELALNCTKTVLIEFGWAR